MSVAVADFDEETDRGNSESKKNSFFLAIEKKISKLVRQGNKSQKQTANKISNTNY